MAFQTLRSLGAHLFKDHPIFIVDLMLESLQTRGGLDKSPPDYLGLLWAADFDSRLEWVRCATQRLDG